MTAAVLFGIGPDVLAAATDRQTRIVALAANGSLSIEITVGDVRIQGAERGDALVEIVRQAPTAAALTRIPIVVDDTSPAVAIRATQTAGTTDPSLRTNVTVTLPRVARLEHVRVMEGRLTIQGFAGTIGADVRRGPIEATDISGLVRLETGIGDIGLKQARLVPGGLLRLRAFNGDVRLSLAERPQNARVLALALNGTISSVIPLTMKDQWGPRWGETTLGTGEPVISIDIITGKIAIAVEPK